VREARAGLPQLDDAPGLELATKVEQEPRDLGPPVELGLDSRKRAAAIPERTGFAEAALRVALGDQLDRAEMVVLAIRLHAARLAAALRGSIRAAADPAAESYGG